MITEKDIIIKQLEDKVKNQHFTTYHGSLALNYFYNIDKNYVDQRSIDLAKDLIKKEILHKLYGELYRPAMEVYVMSKKNFGIDGRCQSDYEEFDRAWNDLLKLINQE